MVGSATLAEQINPEEWKQTIEPVQSTVGRLVTAHHGMLAQEQGDALIAFFGPRMASEAVAENAVRAGLAAQAAVEQLALPHLRSASAS